VWAPSLHDSLVKVLDAAQVKTEFEAWEHVSTTQGMVAAGLALTSSAPPWLENAEGIELRPLADARIEVRTSAAWQPRNAAEEALESPKRQRSGRSDRFDPERSDVPGRHPGETRMITVAR